MSFFECVPTWIVRIIETRKCSACGSSVSRQSIQAFGIRSILNGKTCTFYVEHKCPNCTRSTITSFGGQRQGSPVELAYELIEYEQGKRRTAKAKQSRKQSNEGLIDDGEVNELLTFMHNSDSHEEFLKFIGHEVEQLPESDNED